MVRTKIEKRLWITGLIALVTITGAYMYNQVSKVLSYTLKFVGLREVKFDKSGVSFKMLYEYSNKANISVTIAQQEYEVYINGQYLTTLSNFAPNVLEGGSKSTIEINVSLTPEDFKKVKLNWVQVLLEPKSIEIKTIMKWKIKYGIVKFPVTYPYILNLKQIIGWYVPAIKKL
jgi:LEA14-like dessication related protein